MSQTGHFVMDGTKCKLDSPLKGRSKLFDNVTYGTFTDLNVSSSSPEDKYLNLLCLI